MSDPTNPTTTFAQEQLLAKAYDAIDAVYNDTSLSDDQRIQSLLSLQNQTADRIKAIEVDREEGGAQ